MNNSILEHKAGHNLRNESTSLKKDNDHEVYIPYVLIPFYYIYEFLFMCNYRKTSWINLVLFWLDE